MCKYTTYKCTHSMIYTFIHLFTDIIVFFSILTDRHPTTTHTCAHTPVRNIWKYAVGKCDYDPDDNIFIGEAITNRLHI